MTDKMTRDEVLAAMDDAVEALESDQRYYDSGALQKTRAAVSALYDEVEALKGKLAVLLAAAEELQASMDENEENASKFDGSSAFRFVRADEAHRKAIANAKA